jgi:23S rRNA (cytosine1962-C5)-methyltransferase
VNFELPVIGDGEDKSSALKNCIRNNYKHVRKWAKRTMTNCFRIYDWQIPSYALSIDYYAGKFLIHYFSKTQEDLEPKEFVRKEAIDALKSLFFASEDDIYWRTRIKRKKLQQYEKQDNEKQFFNVLEYGVTFKVNLIDYLDTGLFLDHRETRKIVRDHAKGKKVLNLFAYTSSFGVQAAVGGAKSTKNVDLSNTYCRWSIENFKANHLSLKNNEVIRADCLKFLHNESMTTNQYDIIVIDPPTISRSKKMEKIFDVQVSYVELIKGSLKLLKKGGMIFFSTNSRKFHFDKQLFEGLKIQDLSKKTIPIDFHDPKIHLCWQISQEVL